MSHTVLVIESDPWLRDHYQREIEKRGYTVVNATNPYAAMDMIDDDRPDAIVMNVLLSGASGIGLLHELQTYFDTAVIPVIICTSHGGLKLDDLAPYGVRRLHDTSTMTPDELIKSVRSVLA